MILLKLLSNGTVNYAVWHMGLFITYPNCANALMYQYLNILHGLT